MAMSSRFCHAIMGIHGLMEVIFAGKAAMPLSKKELEDQDRTCQDGSVHKRGQLIYFHHGVLLHVFWETQTGMPWCRSCDVSECFQTMDPGMASRIPPP